MRTEISKGMAEDWYFRNWFRRSDLHMSVRLILLFVLLSVTGCANYNSGRDMPYSVFDLELSQLTSTTYLPPRQRNLLLAKKSCVAVGYHRVAATNSYSTRSEMRNAAEKVDSWVTYIGADSYAIDNFKWIEAPKRNTELHVQIVGIDCNPTLYTQEAENDFYTDFNQYTSNMESYNLKRKREIEKNQKEAKAAAWARFQAGARNASDAGGGTALGNYSKGSAKQAEPSRQRGQQQTTPASQPSQLNRPYLKGQAAVVGGSMCRYSDGSVKTVVGSYCPRRN